MCPVFDWLCSNHRFRFFPVTHGSILHLTVPTSAYPLAFPEAFASSAILLSARLRVVACSLDRPPERASRELFRSDQVFCVPVGSSLSAGSRGSSREPHRCSRPLSDRDHFGQRLLPPVVSLPLTPVTPPSP